MTIESRLAELGIALLKSPAPLGNFTYVPVKVFDRLAFVSGQLPRRLEAHASLTIVRGTVGLDTDISVAYEAVRLCGISLLSVLKESLGSLDRVKSVVKVEGFVNSVSSFRDHPSVINGCSDLLVSVFGQEAGSHARVAVGCSSLPLGACVEVSAIFEIENS